MIRREVGLRLPDSGRRPGGKRMIKSRAMLLAGVSALAMLACVAEADAETFIFTGGVQSFTVPTSGEYALDVFGASGGASANAVGGLGAEVSGDIFLTAGDTLTLFVGGRGQNSFGGGNGGGGGGFVFLGANVLAVAGGGGGASYHFGGGPGQAATAGEMGGGANGGAGGASGSGGGGGTYVSPFSGYAFANGGGGAGADSGAAGYGGDGAGSRSGFGAKFPNGGAYRGGFGGGGGGGSSSGDDTAGGGGGGFSGGGGGSGEYASGHGQGFGGGGGGSYLSNLFTNQILTAGVNSGDGSISVTLLTPAVPEPSTWAMTLAGFAGLGWLTRMRRRKTSPA